MSTHQIRHIHNPECTDVTPFSQPGFFFNELAHLRQQHADFHLLSAVNVRTGQTDARCAFFTQNDVALSPLAAPFGSIEFVPNLPDPVLKSLLHTLLETARGTGATTLRLVSYPDCYAPAQANRLCPLLTNHNFSLIHEHENFYLPVIRQPFSERIVPAEKRRLRKCRNAGFTLGEWPAADLLDALNFLQTVRQKRGHNLPMSTDHLHELVSRFPHQFSVFGVWNEHCQPIALSITVRVRHDILYNFLPVSDPAYDSFSPMVLLIDGLYEHCQRQQIPLLDLGTALSADHSFKPGLARFKRNLGADVSAKRVVEVSL